MPGEYVVQFKPDINASQIRAALAGLGSYELVDLGNGQLLVRFRVDPGLDALREAALRSGIATAVQPNFIYRYNGSDRWR